MENITMETERKTQSDNEKEINLAQIGAALLNKWFVIVLVGAVCGVLAFIYFRFFVTPQYTSTTQIMVINRQNENSITATDITSASSLSKDYVVIVTSDTVMERVIANLSLNMTVDELAGKVTASLVTDTRQIRIDVKDPDPILAKKIADSVAQISSQRICEIMSIENMVEIIDPGNMPTKASSPRTLRNTIIVAIIGILISSVIVVIADITNDTIKNAEDVEKYLGCSVLGIIPVFEGEASSKGKKKKSGKQ